MKKRKAPGTTAGSAYLPGRRPNDKDPSIPSQGVVSGQSHFPGKLPKSS